VRINENSSFRVPGGKQRGKEVRLNMGQLWTRMLHKMAKISVRTPTAVAAVRGTEADIEMRDKMTVKVYEGLVDIMNGKGKQSLRAGQMSSVAGAGSAPTAPKKMASSDYSSWQSGVTAQDMNSFLKQLQEATDKEKTMDIQINKGGKTKKVKVNLKKKE